MTNKEINILRKLAARKRELCDKTENIEKKKLYKSINSLIPLKPAILVSPEGSWRELIPEISLECEDEQLRAWELVLRKDIFKLKYRSLSVDRETTFKRVEEAKSIFGDILPVRIRGQYWWSAGITRE